jgi:Tfp pilus assembly protein PilO
MNKKSDNYIVLTSITILLICFIFSWQMLLPRYKDNKQNLDSVQKELTAATDRLNSLKNAKATLNTLGTVVDKMLVAVPANPDIPNLISELEAIAVRNRAYIPSIEVTNKEESADGGSVELAFSVTGNYSDIHNFITGLEQDMRYMNIKSATISSSGSSMTLGLTVEAFYRGVSDSLTGGV